MKSVDIDFKKERSIGEVINASFTFFVNNFLPLIKYALTFSFPFFVLGLILIGSTFVRLFLDQDYFMYNSYGYKIRMFISSIILSVGLIILITSVLAYVRIYINNGREAITRSEIWKLVRRKFFPMVGLYLMFGFIIAILLVIFLSMLSAIDSGTVTIVFLLSFIASFLSVFFYSSTAIILKDISAPESLSKSFEMITGTFWFTLGLIVIMIILIFILGLLSSVPSIVIGYLSSYFNIGILFSQIISVIFTAVNLIIIFLAFMAFLSMKAIQYYNVVEKREQTSLKEKLDSIISSNEEVVE
jgi:hypothetical protein